MRLRTAVVLLLLASAVLLPSIASAHVGSPDVFLDGEAGPYRLFVTVAPPHAVPGVADVQVLTTSSDVRQIKIVPLPLTGPGAQFAPTPDVAVQSPADPRLFTGRLWMMTAGSWQVRVAVSGDRGSGNLSVPVPTMPQSTLAMTAPRRALLVVFMVILAAGFISIVSAIAREAPLAPGTTPDSRAWRRGRVAGVIAAAIVAAAVVSGNRWWTAEASSYARYVYKPLQGTPTLTPDGRLRLDLHDPGWIASRRLDDLIPDHDHLMHLFVVTPALDRLLHLHPDQVATGAFEVRLPDVPRGEYEVFADVVHRTGVPETVTGHFDTAGLQGAPLTGDDAEWTARASDIDDGRIVWQRDDQPIVSKRLTMFTFRVEDGAGKPATDLELYMGMPGHAIFIRTDRQVFAHVHPSGSAPMAALQLAMPSNMSHVHSGGLLPPTVSFPYGFPEPGDYRIFVQVKRSGRIVTGAFDAHVQ